MTAFSPKEKLTLYLNSTADSLRALLAVAMAAACRFQCETGSSGFRRGPGWDRFGTAGAGENPGELHSRGISIYQKGF
jgi:hypothetical protein